MYVEPFMLLITKRRKLKELQLTQKKLEVEQPCSSSDISIL